MYNIFTKLTLVLPQETYTAHEVYKKLYSTFLLCPVCVLIRKTFRGTLRVLYEFCDGKPYSDTCKNILLQEIILKNDAANINSRFTTIKFKVYTECIAS